MWWNQELAQCLIQSPHWASPLHSHLRNERWQQMAFKSKINCKKFSASRKIGTNGNTQVASILLWYKHTKMPIVLGRLFQSFCHNSHHALWGYFHSGQVLYIELAVCHKGLCHIPLAPGNPGAVGWQATMWRHLVGWASVLKARPNITIITDMMFAITK